MENGKRFSLYIMWMWRMSGILCVAWSGTSYLLLFSGIHVHSTFIDVDIDLCTKWYSETNNENVTGSRRRRRAGCYIHTHKCAFIMCISFLYSGKSNRFGIRKVQQICWTYIKDEMEEMERSEDGWMIGWFIFGIFWI